MASSRDLRLSGEVELNDQTEPRSVGTSKKRGQAKAPGRVLRHLPPFNYLAEAAAGNTCHSLRLDKYHEKMLVLPLVLRDW